MEGYVSEYHVARTDLIPDAFMLIVLDLAARHLIDYLEESYFQWDRVNYTTSAEFNLARARRYIAYYKEIKKSFA